MCSAREIFAVCLRWAFGVSVALRRWYPIVIAALYWRGLTKAGAIAGVMAAIISWCVLFYMGTQVPVSEGGLSKFVIRIGDHDFMPVVGMIVEFNGGDGGGVDVHTQDSATKRWISFFRRKDDGNRELTLLVCPPIRGRSRKRPGIRALPEA